MAKKNEDLIKFFILKNIDDDPFYIVNLAKVKELYKIWVANFPNIKPYYAVKCNPDFKIIKLLATLGCNFDCASKKEIKEILEITKDPTRIIYANPCKQSSYIKYASYYNVKLMTFDSIEELYKISLHCKDAKLILRIAVNDSNSLCKFNSKFGCKINDNIFPIFDYIKNNNLNLHGISFHVGSGCKDANSFYTALKDSRYVYDIGLEYGYRMKIIDIGGGFAYNEDNVSFFYDIATHVNKGVEEFFNDTPDIEFIAEPGRFFTETSHTLVVNVTSKKKEDSVIKYYLNDGIYGSFNCIYYDHQKPVFKLLNSSNRDIRNSTLFGPTCDSMDVIYKDIMMQEMEIGDWLYVENFGSYTKSPCGSFNGFTPLHI